MKTVSELIPQALLASWERGPELAEKDIVAFERRTKVTLPADYREFLLKVNGGRPPMERSVFNDGIVNVFLALGHEDESYDLEARVNATWSRPPSDDLIMIGYDDGAAPIFLCIRGDHYGEVWWLNTSNLRPPGSNPRVKWFERRDMGCLGKNFVEFLQSLRPYDSIQTT